MERLIDGERRLRREYSAAFKALVLEQTRECRASVSGDRVIATAILDRLLHHAVTLNI